MHWVVFCANKVIVPLFYSHKDRHSRRQCHPYHLHLLELKMRQFHKKSLKCVTFRETMRLVDVRPSTTTFINQVNSIFTMKKLALIALTMMMVCISAGATTINDFIDLMKQH